MWFTLVPVLGALRRLYDMPRDAARFDAYTGLVRLGEADAFTPLADFDPMAPEHMGDALDTLLAVDAEREAVEVLRQIGPRLRGLPAEWGEELRVMFMLSDDIGAMWVRRPMTELKLRVSQRALLAQHWVSPRFWSSDNPTTSDVRATTLTAIYRALYQISYGPSKTVAGLLQQERRTLAFAGTGESLPAEEEAALRTAVTPYLAATDEGTQVAVLFGDRIAVALGYGARGIPERGGLRLAASEAVRERDPIASLLG